MKNTDFINYINMLEKSDSSYNVYHNKEETEIIIRLIGTTITDVKVFFLANFSISSEDLVRTEFFVSD